MRFNFFFTESQSVYSERLTLPRQNFDEVKSYPAGLVSGWETSKYTT